MPPSCYIMYQNFIFFFFFFSAALFSSSARCRLSFSLRASSTSCQSQSIIVYNRCFWLTGLIRKESCKCKNCPTIDLFIKFCDLQTLRNIVCYCKPVDTNQSLQEEFSMLALFKKKNIQTHNFNTFARSENSVGLT